MQIPTVDEMRLYNFHGKLQSKAHWQAVNMQFSPHSLQALVIFLCDFSYLRFFEVFHLSEPKLS